MPALDQVLQEDAAFRAHPTYRRRSPAFSTSAPRFAKSRQAGSKTDYYCPDHHCLAHNSSPSHQSIFRSSSPRLRPTRKLAAPPIGAYEPKGPEWVLPTKKGSLQSSGARFRSRSAAAPPPGAYDPVVDRKGRPSFEQKAARLNVSAPRFARRYSDNPPPGSYETEIDRKGDRLFSRPTATIRSTSPRFANRNSSSPPPGAYDDPRPSFSSRSARLNTSAPRFSRAPPSPAPAVGQYEYNTSSFLRHPYVTGTLRH